LELTNRPPKPIIATMSELDVTGLMTVSKAIAIIDAAPVQRHIDRVPLMKTLGLRLAADIRADRDFPPFNKSLMDGYALRAADLAKAPLEFPIVAHIAAGSAARDPLREGQAMAIMTGAPIPAGADIVIPVEQTELIEPGNKVRINGNATGNNIARAGSDVRARTIVLHTGTKIGPAQIAVAAGVGAIHLDVFRAPSTAVLGTGDEIVPIDATPGPEQIRGSNNAMLTSLLQTLGCSPRDLGTCRDDRQATRDAILNGLDGDALFITGGMSMGERDYVPAILKELGADFRVTKLRIKPGKPFVFAIMPNGKFVFGLPGNPVSAFVCTLRLASRLLTNIAGGVPPAQLHRAQLAESLPANGPREFYQPAIFVDGAIKPLGWKGSADIFTLAQAQAFIVRDENEPAKAAGEWVQILNLP
jgi:molybdopterin molybdotransferase